MRRGACLFSALCSKSTNESLTLRQAKRKRRLLLGEANQQSIAGYFTTCLAMSELSLPTMTRNPLPRQRLCLLFLRF